MDANKLLADVQQTYRKIKETAQDKLREEDYAVSWIWAGNLSKQESCLFDAADALDSVRRISATHLYNIPRTGEKLLKSIDWQAENFRRTLGYDLPAGYAESPLHAPDIYVQRDGRPISNEVFRNAYLCELFRRTHPSPGPQLTALELGAGMGNLARTLLSARAVGRYVVIDIQSTLVFSYLFLRLSFPEKRAVFATSVEEARAAIADGTDLVFIPSHFDRALDCFRPDLFVNTASLGEMPNTTIRHWISMVQERAEPRFLLVSNRYLNPVPPFIVEARKNENEASVLFDHRWRVRHWWFDPFYAAVPMRAWAPARSSSSSNACPRMRPNAGRRRGRSAVPPFSWTCSSRSGCRS